MVDPKTTYISDNPDRTHPTTGKPIGRWMRSQGYRYWEGACTCGSGRDGVEVYDDHGIYFGISCTLCNRKPTPGHMHEEPIEPEDY